MKIEELMQRDDKKLIHDMKNYLSELQWQISPLVDQITAVADYNKWIFQGWNRHRYISFYMNAGDNLPQLSPFVRFRLSVK